MRNVLFAAVAASLPLARAHICFYHPGMWGWDVRAEDFPYDNRPETPLQQYTFEQWWFHGHLGQPPPPDQFFELPAGGTAVSQLACNKGATIYWAESDGHTDIRQGDYPCPNYPTSQFHTTGVNDVKGCALSIAYTSDVNSIQPEDLAIFSVNHQCVWTVNTQFQIPADMPPCPDGGCICAWHWIHSVDSGSAQMYMNGFRCKVTGSTSNTPISKPEVPKRCTGDITKCNQGAQQPLYWFQAERNNMFNDQYDPPYYLDEWGFLDGPQNKIFGTRDDSSSTITTTTSSSTPSNQPSSTPASQPVSTPGSPAMGNPSSSVPPMGNSSPSVPQPSPSSPSPPPVYNGGNNPAPAPSPPPANNSNNNNNSGNNNTGNNNSNNTGPPSSPPANNDPNEIDDPASDPPCETTTSSVLPSPSPSGKPRCRQRKDKKRHELVSRHFKHKRHHGHTH
jgi:hypothetical protein